MMKRADHSDGFRCIALAVIVSCALLGCFPEESPETSEVTAPGDDIDALAAKLNADPQYMWKILENREEMLPLILEAQKRTPENPVWANTISMFFAADRFDVKGLPAEDRRKHYEAALRYLEQAAQTIEAASPEARPFLKERAIASVEAGSLDDAKRLAKKALEENTDRDSWDYGNVIHWAYTVLGRAAIRENDVEAAKRFLLESAMTAGSPQLESFGPSFVLAREVLEMGEKGTVLEYLDLVAEFWANPVRAAPVTSLAGRNAQEHAEQLEEWREEIDRGRIPRSERWR
jgi:tetratricopeptide (TPR) repeat protein